jgi:hypothetical protein
MISKVKRLDNDTKQMIYKSEIIRKIENYPYRFSPIESYKEMKMKNIESKTNIITCYFRNIQKTTLGDYITEKIENKRIIEILNSIQDYLRESIQQLNQVNLFLNITEQIIVMDEINDVPIIILDTPTTPPNNQPIEYYILNYENENQPMTTELGEELFQRFITAQGELFEPKYQKITNTEFIEFKERYGHYIRQLSGQSIKKIKTSIKPAVKTWGDYYISVIFISIMTDLDDLFLTPELLEFINKHKRIVLGLPNERTPTQTN